MTKCRTTRIMNRISWALFLISVFFAGWTAATGSAFQRGFETGYDAASNHISTRIREGMNDMQPFYISDIGFRFSPRGFTITDLRFIGDERAYSAKAEVAE